MTVMQRKEPVAAAGPTPVQRHQADLQPGSQCRHECQQCVGQLALSRSAEMEALVRTEVAKLVDDWRSGSSRYGGLIYCMGWREPNLFMRL